jgi:hypothetical protein
LRCKTYALRGISLFVATVTAAGCSADEPKREFAVPKALCGVSVPTDALSRLLPSSGKQLATDKVESSSNGDGLCNVTVDSDKVLVLDMERIDVGDSARNILRSRLSIQQQKSTEGGAIAYADWAAVSMVQCRGAGVEKEDISILIKVLKPARPNESAMKSLISGYTASLKKQQPCKKGS